MNSSFVDPIAVQSLVLSLLSPSSSLSTLKRWQQQAQRRLHQIRWQQFVEGSLLCCVVLLLQQSLPPLFFVLAMCGLFLSKQSSMIIV